LRQNNRAENSHQPTRRWKRKTPASALGAGGSGVGAVAAGKSFTGIELDPKYFDIAQRRISEALSRPRLPFDEPVQPKAGNPIRPAGG
jgi:hypothetical protein